MLFKTKSAVIPLVTLSLLMIASVAAYFMMYNWFLLYLSEQEVRLDANNFEDYIEVIRIFENNLILNNDYKEKFLINNVLVNNRDCSISKNLTLGLNNISLTNCLATFEDSTILKVDLFTNFGIFSSYSKFEPDFIPSYIDDLYIWIDASDTSTITSIFGQVTQIDDKSDYGFDFTQSLGSESPSTNFDTKNGLNVLTMDGEDYLISNGIVYPSDGTVFIVAYVDSPTSFGTESIWSIQGTADYQLDAGTTPDYRFQVNANFHSNFVYNGSDLTDTWGVYILRHSRDDNTSKTYFNNVVSSNSVTDYTVSHSASQDARIFTNREINQEPSGYFAELIVYGSALSDEERTKVYDYLVDKWGLS